jgi:hypothetical protein
LAGDGRMEARQGRDEAVTRRLGSRQPFARAAHKELLAMPGFASSLIAKRLREIGDLRPILTEFSL